jgi:nicotinamide-nucleotide amidase
MRAEVVAIGSELLLGQIVDTNSAYIGEQLALAGIDSHFQVKVGDNQARMVAAIRQALSRSEAVICCGGLGPTQDDITREAIAEVMGVDLVSSQDLVQVVRDLFAARGRTMPDNNLRQALVPVGATVIPQTRGTAPGLICPVGAGVVYAVPGVPHEMRDMITRAVIPDLTARAGERATIRSRTLRTWGQGESTVAEVVAPRLEALDATGGNPTIAFLASGIEGIKVRVTAKGTGPNAAADAERRIAAEEAELRALLGDTVFGVDDDTMEVAVSRLLIDLGATLGVAESLTGGLIASRLTAVPGASEWFRGGVVSYASDVKRDVLGVGEGPVVTAEAAAAMAAGAARVLGATVGLAVTGVAGPTEQEGQPVGTVWVGLDVTRLGVAADGQGLVTRQLKLAGDRERIRQATVIWALDGLRHLLLTRLRAAASD